jgi:hypothetical protein
MNHLGKSAPFDPEKLSGTQNMRCVEGLATRPSSPLVLDLDVEPRPKTARLCQECAGKCNRFCFLWSLAAVDLLG